MLSRRPILPFLRVCLPQLNEPLGHPDRNAPRMAARNRHARRGETRSSMQALTVFARGTATTAGEHKGPGRCQTLKKLKWLFRGIVNRSVFYAYAVCSVGPLLGLLIIFT